MSHNYAIYLINQEIKRISEESIETVMNDGSVASRVFMMKNLQRGKEALIESVKVLEAAALDIETKKAD